jgi:hypothetical protein
MTLSFTGFWIVMPRGLVARYSGVCYNERCYKERMLQRTDNERGGILSADVARAYARRVRL